MNEPQTSPTIKRNVRNISMVIGILALLLVAYYFGSHTRKSAEVITPTIQNENISGVVPVSGPSTRENKVSSGVYDYTEAVRHIGENVTIRGTVVDVYISKTGTVFFDFCKSYKTCPFSAVVFSSKTSGFPNIKQYAGQTITVTGVITSYQGKAEIVIDSPNQIAR